MDHLISFDIYPRALSSRAQVENIGQMDYSRSNSMPSANTNTYGTYGTGPLKRHFFTFSENGIPPDADAWTFFGFKNIPVALNGSQSRFVHILGFRFGFSQTSTANGVYQTFLRYICSKNTGGYEIHNFLEIDMRTGIVRTIATPQQPSIQVLTLASSSWNNYIEIVREWDGAPNNVINAPQNGGTIKFYLNGILVKTLNETQIPIFQNKMNGAKWEVWFGQLNKVGNHGRNWSLFDIYSRFYRTPPSSNAIRRFGPIAIVRSKIDSIQSIDLEPDELNTFKNDWNDDKSKSLSVFAGFNNGFQIRNELYHHPTTPKPIKAISHIAKLRHYFSVSNPYNKQLDCQIMVDDETTATSGFKTELANYSQYSTHVKECFLDVSGDDLDAQTNNYHTQVSLTD